MLSLSCDLWHQSRCLTSIHKSPPMASWDCKVLTECALQNL